MAWCQQFGKGRSFSHWPSAITEEVWKDPRFQDHLLGGLKWAAQVTYPVMHDAQR